MSFLPNVFSDPVLKARQDQLDGQWKSLWALYQGCDQTPDNAFSQFVNDKRAWDEFYDSGSDWSDDSKHATDNWQLKAQEWAGRLNGWGCYGTSGSANLDTGSSGIPTIKDPPKDEPSFLDKLTDSSKTYFTTVGIVGVALFVFVILAIVFVLSKGKASGFGVSLGGG